MIVNGIDLSAGEEMNHLIEDKVQPTTIHIYNSDDIMKTRLDTCIKCQYVTSERTCSKCNCPVVMMSQFNFKICPEGYWQ
jgi:hypothetical protein